MLCLSNSSLSNTSKHDFAHPTAVNNNSTICQDNDDDDDDDDMHDNNYSSNNNDVNNDSYCCMIPVTAMRHSPFSMVLVPM